MVVLVVSIPLPLHLQQTFAPIFMSPLPPQFEQGVPTLLPSMREEVTARLAEIEAETMLALGVEMRAGLAVAALETTR